MARYSCFVLSVFFAVSLVLLFSVTEARGQAASAWTLLEKIDEPDDDLKDISLKIGKKRYTHQEKRIVYNSQGKITSIRTVRITDFEREVALKLINFDTGATEIIKITKKGRQLIAPAGYEIEVVKRQNGIEWNGRNTHFKVTKPASTVILKLAWPNESSRMVVKTVVNKKGKKTSVRRTEKYVENIIYSPYSADDPNTSSQVEAGLHTSEVVAGGVGDIRNIFSTACQNLRDRGVMSKAFPNSIVCDLSFLPLEAYQRLPLIEQMDESEFYLDPRKTAERVLVVLRANPNRAFMTCNSSRRSRACGLMQFTDRWLGRNPGTYSTVVRAYPSAQLIKSFPAGAFDHVNSAMAAILLHDLNLKSLVDRYGQKIIQDSVLLEMALAGCYNGNPKWTYLALDDFFSGKIKDWTVSGHLRTETRGYLVKDRYLIDNNLP